MRMKMTGWKTGLMAAAMSIAMAGTAFAGWQQDGARWRWQQEDGSYFTNTWQWLDGNQDGIAECYYFGADGYMLANTTTPDGYQVNAEGAWTVNGIVKTNAAAQNAAGNAAAQGAAGVDASGIDRSIGNGFIYQKWIDILGRNQSEVRQLLGEPLAIEGVDETAWTYGGKGNVAVSVYFKDGIVNLVAGLLTDITVVEDKDKYAIPDDFSAMNAEYLGENAYGLGYVWRLQENPGVYFALKHEAALRNIVVRLLAFKKK